MFGHIREGPITIVVVERVVVNAADKNVLVAVVIEVTDGNARIVASSGETGFFGYIGKCAIAIVVEEPVPVLRRSLFLANREVARPQ